MRYSQAVEGSQVISALRLAALLPLTCALLAGCPHKRPSDDAGPAKDPNAPPLLHADNPPLSPEKKSVRLLFGGDVLLGRGVEGVFEKHGKGNAAYMFEPLRKFIEGADLFFVNLESVLADTKSGEAEGKNWRLRAKESAAVGLAAAGVDVVSVSNNHMHDFGREGFATTLERLAENGVRVAGAKFDEKDKASQPLLVMNVGPLKVGLLAYRTHGDGYKHETWFPHSVEYNEKQMVAEAKAAAAAVDVLVVSFHWGRELDHSLQAYQPRFAHRLVDAGADIVVGHGPHGVQPFEQYKDGIIAYSVGDLLFDKSTPFVKQRSSLRFMLAVDYDGKERTGFEVIPLRAGNDYRPVPLKDFDVSVWERKPEAGGWSAHAQLARAIVERVRGGEVELCDKWTTRQGKHPISFGRWLRPRWVCPGDKPGMEVATSTETFAFVPEIGVWATPHTGGPLRLRYENVPYGATLQVVMGTPEYPASRNRSAPPVVVRVMRDKNVLFTERVQHGSGWATHNVDTRRWANKPGPLTIEVESAEKPPETGFLVDVRIAANAD